MPDTRGGNHPPAAPGARRRCMTPSAPMREPVPARFNLARYCLAENARLRPNETALTVVGDDHAQRWTHGELDRKCARWRRASPRSAFRRARAS